MITDLTLKGPRRTDFTLKLLNVPKIPKRALCFIVLPYTRNYVEFFHFKFLVFSLRETLNVSEPEGFLREIFLPFLV